MVWVAKSRLAICDNCTITASDPGLLCWLSALNPECLNLTLCWSILGTLRREETSFWNWDWKGICKGQEEEQILLLTGCSLSGVVLAESFTSIKPSDRPMAPPGPFGIWAIVLIGRMDTMASGQLSTFTKDSTA